MTTAELLHLYEYNQWAHERIIEAVAGFMHCLARDVGEPATQVAA